MAIPSFYQPQLNLDDQQVSLDANEASHAVRSRRLRAGQTVRLFNGRGLVALGELVVVGRREVIVQLNSCEQLPIPQRKFSVASAVPKGDRQKIMVDMLTQLGVFEIIPLHFERSVTSFSKNMAEKWRRVAIEACKQSQNPWLPTICDSIELTDLLEQRGQQSVVANASGECLDDVANKFCELTVIVGPEGGFSNLEFTKLKEYEVSFVAMGPYILRTEVAAITAAGLLAGMA